MRSTRVILKMESHNWSRARETLTIEIKPSIMSMLMRRTFKIIMGSIIDRSSIILNNILVANDLLVVIFPQKRQSSFILATQDIKYSPSQERPRPGKKRGTRTRNLPPGKQLVFASVCLVPVSSRKLIYPKCSKINKTATWAKSFLLLRHNLITTSDAHLSETKHEEWGTSVAHPRDLQELEND